ncbi:hypothetical protein GOBAR_AA39512 [Gossypium barbadense]|uniref:Uncharacterized protein n=1 Tax=Gossypium barbadense TaxID=3634 RepID=A0A2P5VQT5_GOSBA|nr:hypothetical protein GOBAR_AA39512 [Gossypium barbadense]
MTGEKVKSDLSTVLDYQTNDGVEPGREKPERGKKVQFEYLLMSIRPMKQLEVKLKEWLEVATRRGKISLKGVLREQYPSNVFVAAKCQESTTTEKMNKEK